MKIREAKIEDIMEISELEKRIEENPASYETLVRRFQLFPEGFYVAEDDGQIIGYIESCIWNKKEFNSFEEIKEFQKHHDVNASTLYIIFLATSPDYRNRGIGSMLLQKLINKASRLKKKKVQLVSKDGLESFYSRFGFRNTKHLPNFLANNSGALMELYLELHQGDRSVTQANK